MNLNKISKKVLTRLGLIVLMLTILGGVLTSCGGNSYRATVTKNQEITVADGDTTHGLTQKQLNELADEIVKSKSALTIREQLVAALRGYDMNDAGFDDTKVGGELQPQPEKAPDFAITALKKGSIETFEYVNKDGSTIMTTADVQSLVDSLRSTVNTESKMGLVDRLLHWLALGFEWMINTLGFGNFTLGTVWFAIAVEILMLPLGIHQQKNSRKQARLRPKEMAIRAKYKGRDDQATRQKLTMEIQQMYQAEGYSPMAGCLPMLISLPFLFALYYIVVDPLHYMMGCSAEVGTALISYVGTSRAAGGLGMSLAANTRGTIEVLSVIREGGLDLSGIADFAFFKNGAECLEVLQQNVVGHIPNFTLFGLNLGINPGFHEPYALLAIPVLTFVVYFASMKLSRKLTFQPTGDQKDPAQGCSNTIMDVSMPLMSAWFAFQVPAAIGLYWMFKSIISTVKQFVVAKVMPLPKFTEEDYKAAERELMGKEKSKPAKRSELPTGSTGGRSLHYIDDEEDYATTRKGESGESMHHIDDGAELQPTPPAHNGSKKKKKNRPEDAPVEEAPAEETESVEATEPVEPADLPEKNGAVNIAPLKDDRHNNDRRPEDRG